MQVRLPWVPSVVVVAVICVVREIDGLMVVAKDALTVAVVCPSEIDGLAVVERETLAEVVACPSEGWVGEESVV